MFENPNRADEHEFEISDRAFELRLEARARETTEGGHKYERVDGISRMCQLCHKKQYRSHGGYAKDKSVCKKAKRVA